MEHVLIYVWRISQVPARLATKVVETSCANVPIPLVPAQSPIINCHPWTKHDSCTNTHAGSKKGRGHLHPQGRKVQKSRCGIAQGACAADLSMSTLPRIALDVQNKGDIKDNVLRVQTSCFGPKSVQDMSCDRRKRAHIQDPAPRFSWKL